VSQADTQLGLLIASPQMRDPNFEQTVILVCQHDDQGAIGLVINRGGPVSVGEVLAGLEMAEDGPRSRPTWWGGPVGQGTGFVIWSGVGSPDEGWNLPHGVAVSPSADRLQKLVNAEASFQLCLGYAGWSPGQLTIEIEEGSWLYTEIDPGLVFEAPLEERYDRALALLGLSSDILWMQPIDA
jgi:putative transcriptional regulator